MVKLKSEKEATMPRNYLKEIIDERRLKYQEIADATGVTKAAVAYWVKEKLPTGEKLEALCKFLGVEPSYLQYGISGSAGGSIEVDEDTVSIPVLDVSGGCWPAGRNNHIVTMVSMIRVAKEWILARAVAPNFSKLHIINAFGDSMKPLIDEGDFVIVDTSKNELMGDGVYVVQSGENTFIKRVQRQINGRILLLSDNPLYKPYEVPPEEMDTLRIIGKCIIVCNAKDL